MHICVLSHVSVFLTHLAASDPNPDPIRVESVSYTSEPQTDFKQKITYFEFLVPPRVKLNLCFHQITTKNHTTTRPSGTINHNHISCAFCCALWLCPSAQCIAFWSRFVNCYLHFSLFLHCLRSKIRIFYSLCAAIITFITIIPQFAAIFKCFPLSNANKPSKRRKISLKSQNFFQKTQIYHSDSKNRHLQLRSSCTIKMCHRIRGFSLFLFPPTSIYLIFKTLASQPPQISYQLQSKAPCSPDRFQSITATPAKQPHPRAPTSPQCFFTQQKVGATQPRGR